MSTIAGLLPFANNIANAVRESVTATGSEKIDLFTKKCPIVSRFRRPSSSSFTAQTRGLHFRERQTKWNDHVLKIHTNCLDSLIELMKMKSQQIANIKEHIAKAQRGIPALPEHPHETDFHHRITAQWCLVMQNIAEVAHLCAKKRSKEFPAEISEILGQIELRRMDVIRLTTTSTLLQTKLIKAYQKTDSSIRNSEAA